MIQTNIEVKLQKNGYSIHAGIGILRQAGQIIKNLIKGQKILIVSNKKVFKLYGKTLIQSLQKYFKCYVFLMGDGEKYKNSIASSYNYRNCSQQGLSSADMVSSKLLRSLQPPA